MTDFHQQNEKREIASGRAAPLQRGILSVFIVLLLAVSGAAATIGQEKPGQKSAEKMPLSTAELKKQQDIIVAKLKQEELDLAEKLLKDFPRKAQTYFTLGDVFRRRGNSAKAFEYWKKCLKINPYQADVYFKMGEAAAEKGKQKEAIGYWRQALEIKPDMTGAHGYIGKALLEEGKYKEAISELKKEAVISPHTALTFYLLGQCYQQQKKLEKARKNYEKSIKLNPDNTPAYYALFNVCMRLGMKDKARDYMSKFRKCKAADMKKLHDRDAIVEIETYPREVADFYAQAAELYWYQGQTAEAKSMLNRALELDPEHVESLTKLASIYRRTGRLDKALQLCGKIKQLKPRDPVSYINVGILYRQLFLFDDAEEAFRKAIELAPRLSLGYQELARLYLRANRKLPSARDLARKALALQKSASNYYLYGWASDVNGDAPAAMRALQRAIRLQPRNIKYQQVYQQILRREQQKKQQQEKTGRKNATGTKPQEK